MRRISGARTKVAAIAVLAASVCAALLVMSLAAPIANATVVAGNGGCLTRQGAVGRSTGHMTRDDIRGTGIDKLSGWLARHPAATTAAESQLASSTPVSIPVVFHVIRKNTTAAMMSPSDRKAATPSETKITKEIRVGG